MSKYAAFQGVQNFGFQVTQNRYYTAKHGAFQGFQNFGFQVNGIPSALRRNLASIMSVSKLPEHIRFEYPSLAVFVKEYYKYLEQLESISNATGLDTVGDKYLQRYKNTVFKGFPNPRVMEMRRFIQNNKELFKLKGTDQAFKYFFRAYFGEEVDIKPSTYMVASGGDIRGSTFFICKILSGKLEPLDVLTIIDDSSVEHNIIIDAVSNKAADVYQVSFTIPRGFRSSVGNICVARSTGTITFRGTVEPTHTRMEVSLPGKHWQRGQLVIFPPATGESYELHPGMHTIARVRNTDNDAGISTLEILRHGYPNNEGVSYTLSPFRYRPNNNDVSYTKTAMRYVDGVPTAWRHTVDIVDNLDPPADSITGALTLDKAQTIRINNISAAVESVTNDTNSYAKWLESRATIHLEMGTVSSEYRAYRTNDNLLSDANTRLHDSLYHQAFAYALLASRDIGEYQGSIDLIHPAGMKFHAQLAKTFIADNSGNINLDVLFFIDRMFLNSHAAAGDELRSKEMLMALATDPNNVDTYTTYVTMLEAIQSFQVNRHLADSINTSDGTPVLHPAPRYNITDYADVSTPYFDNPIIITIS